MIGITGRMGARIARAATWGAALAGMALTPVATQAQVRTIDPNTAIDADLAPPPPASSTPTDPGVDPSLDQGTGATYSAPATTAPPASSVPPTRGVGHDRDRRAGDAGIAARRAVAGRILSGR